MANQDFGELINDFSPGYQTKRTPSDLPMGAAQRGQNIVISDGDKIKPVEGWTLFGAADTSAVGITSATTFSLSTGLEIPIRASGTVIEYYNEGTAAYENLNSGYTNAKRFGFSQFYNSTTQKDEFYFGNGFEPYTKWNGAYSQLNGALSGGETEVVVDSVLTERVHYTGTASATSTTTLDVSPADWATDLWNDIFYVRITSGAADGKISLITDTTTTRITFAAIATLSGTPTFEIRQAKFGNSGTIRIGTTDVTYTSLDQDDRFAGCSNVPAALDDAAMCQAVTEYPGNPIGNILFTMDERMYVAHDEEAAINISAISDATDFTFSATRAAGEGDLGIVPEGGGPITGLGSEEERLVILKRNILKSLTFSKDTDDIVQLTTLIESNSVGTEAAKSVFRVDNDLYYASPEGGIKAVGRVPSVDYVQAMQIADPIRPTVNAADFTDAAGVFYDSKAYIAAKSASTSSVNDIIFVFNFQKKAWELPIVGLNASDFFIYNNELYAASALNNECYQMNTGEYVVQKGTTDFPMLASWESGNLHFGIPANRKAINLLYVEGFIARNTDITVKIKYENNGVYRQISGTIEGDDEDILLVSGSTAPLGVQPLGIGTLGAGSDTQTILNKFRLYFTTSEVPFYEASIVFESDGKGQLWEINRFGFNTVPINQVDYKIKRKMN